MTSALLVIPCGGVREVTVYTVDAIAAILAGPHADCLSSDDGVIDFWFHPVMRTAAAVPNWQATEFLLGNTFFTAATVPLLFGRVIICSHDVEGRLLDLTPADRHQLQPCSWPSRWRLRRRFTRTRRLHRRTSARALAARFDEHS
jgi:hypothetical protein